MKRRVFVNLILVFLLVSSFTQARNAVNDKAESELQNLIIQMVEAQAAYNPQTLEKLLASDYIEISPLGEVDPRDKVLDFYKPADKPANLQMAVEADEFTIRAYDNFAVVIARVTCHATMDSKLLPQRSIRVTYVCHQQKARGK